MARSQGPKASYPVMPPEEFLRARDHFGTPLPVFCDLLGISWRQEVRYRQGDNPVPPPLAKLIRTAIANELEADDIA